MFLFLSSFFLCVHGVCRETKIQAIAQLKTIPFSTIRRQFSVLDPDGCNPPDTKPKPGTAPPIYFKQGFGTYFQQNQLQQAEINVSVLFWLWCGVVCGG